MLNTPLPSSRPGYIFLVSVLVIGVIASATATSLMLLGWAAEQNGLVVVQTSRAFEYAQTCAERAIRSLRADPGYAGGHETQFEWGACEVLAIGGGGNTDRSVCIEGSSGDHVRRMEIDIERLFPSTVIASWKEVPEFTLCP